MTFEYIDLDKLKELLDKGSVTLIDIRTKEEFEAGHLPGAMNINIYDPNFKEKVEKLDKDKEYVIYCRSGSRTEMAKQFFSDFKKVYILKGGLISYF